MKPYEIILNQINEARFKLKDLEAHLKSIRTRCVHNWTTSTYDPIIEKAYIIPADPPGMYGVDRRDECYVPEKRTQRWSRICTECGDIQYTTESTKEVKAIPRF